MIRRQAFRTVVLMAVALAMVAAAAGTDSGAAPAAPAPPPAPQEPVLLEVEDADRLVRDLDALANAWSDGGGTFGYPFWEKAGQRWHDGQLTTTMYREYVTGYRDRLEAGCELIDAVETGTEASGEVRSLVLDACHARVDALQAQRRWLDAEIVQSVAPLPDEEELEAIRARIVKDQEEYRARLQGSYRDARIALELAQGALAQEGRDVLREDAFI